MRAAPNAVSGPGRGKRALSRERGDARVGVPRPRQGGEECLPGEERAAHSSVSEPKRGKGGTRAGGRAGAECEGLGGMGVEEESPAKRRMSQRGQGTKQYGTYKELIDLSKYTKKNGSGILTAKERNTNMEREKARTNPEVLALNGWC